MNIAFNNLGKSFKKNVIFNDLTFELSSEYIYFLTSKNGSGKTTFFKCLIGDYNYAGTISKMNNQITYLPERAAYPPFMKVIDFLRMFNEKDPSKYLREYDISIYQDSLLHKLSKGTRQKVLIIKTILDDADIYLFDEPLEGLDAKSRITFMNQIKELNKMGKIILIATHYYDDYHYSNKKVISLS